MSLSSSLGSQWNEEQVVGDENNDIQLCIAKLQLLMESHNLRLFIDGGQACSSTTAWKLLKRLLKKRKIRSLTVQIDGFSRSKIGKLVDLCVVKKISFHMLPRPTETQSELPVFQNGGNPDQDEHASESASMQGNALRNTGGR